MLIALRRFSRDLVDLAYPGKCVVCSTAVEQGHQFCGACDDLLTQMEDRPQCLKCGAPVSVEDSPCQRCQGRGYRVFEQVIRPAVFETPVRQLVMRFKYYHSWSIGELLAERAWRLARVRALLRQTDLLVPVPLHPRRQIIRGFNQAEVYAARIAALSGVKVRSPLIRTRPTAAQSLQTSRRARFENIRDAFALAWPRMMRNKRITLVDDVVTTASTLKAAADALKSAGPASISVLTIAIADPKGRQFEVI